MLNLNQRGLPGLRRGGLTWMLPQDRDPRVCPEPVPGFLYKALMLFGCVTLKLNRVKGFFILLVEETQSRKQDFLLEVTGVEGEPGSSGPGRDPRDREESAGVPTTLSLKSSSTGP